MRFSQLSILLLGIFALCCASQTCPSTGYACYPGNCCAQYRQCSGTTFWPIQPAPPGTVCKDGVFVFPSECNEPCSSTPSPSPSPTPSPSTPSPSTPSPSTPSPSTPSPSTPSPSTPSPSTPTPTPVCAIVSPKVEPIKVLFPLYKYPNAEGVPVWNRLIAAANAGLHIVAIINPADGPSTTGPDSTYRTNMLRLRDAGIELVGYVDTTYTNVPIQTALGDVDIWANFRTYGIDGIFFDQASSGTSNGRLQYYEQIHERVINHHNFKHLILNHGTNFDYEYINVATNNVIFEKEAFKFPADSANYEDWVKCAPSSSFKADYKYQFSVLIHKAPESDMISLVNDAHAKGIGYIYVTDRNEPNWRDTPTYWNSLVSHIVQLNN